MRLFLMVFFMLSPLCMGAEGPIYDSPDLDYQPSIIRVQPSGDLMVVFERMNTGDFYMCSSSNNGTTWTLPIKINASPKTQRHPSLLQLSSGEFVLYYLVDETGSGSYRIHRASSMDGIAWTSQGALDLGWTSPGEINPCVILEESGRQAMTYHRLYGPSYIALSTDNGLTWDKKKTQISPNKGALPRLAKRKSDGLFLITYQTGSSSCDIWAKVSKDPYNWSGPPISLSTIINSHDSQPIVLTGGVFCVFFAKQVGSVFDLFYAHSTDGINWSDHVRVTTYPSKYDTQPHPLLQGAYNSVILTWSHQESASPYVDHDVWVNTDLKIKVPLLVDKDTLSPSSANTIHFYLDGGQNLANKQALLLGSVSGTTPGTPLPDKGHLPLNWDILTNLIIAFCNTPLFSNFGGVLDNAGQGQSVLNAGGGSNLPLGLILHFAWTSYEPFVFQSNPVELVVTP